MRRGVLEEKMVADFQGDGRAEELEFPQDAVVVDDGSFDELELGSDGRTEHGGVNFNCVGKILEYST